MLSENMIKMPTLYRHVKTIATIPIAELFLRRVITSWKKYVHLSAFKNISLPYRDIGVVSIRGKFVARNYR